VPSPGDQQKTKHPNFTMSEIELLTISRALWDAIVTAEELHLAKAKSAKAEVERTAPSLDTLTTLSDV
jgi:hypothetical protein